MKNLFLKKLTIIIFSYNRQKYLIRTLKYWSNYDIKLLVLDGSSEKLEDPILNNKNIKYIYDPRSLNDRLISSIDYVDTEFTILGCDDEFYLPSALDSCINFLTKNPSYSCCGGMTVGFKTLNGGNEILGFEQYPKLRNFCLDNNDAYKRIEKHFNNYSPAHIYSVMLSSKWKILCRHVYEKEYSFFSAMEVQTEFLLIVSGKSKIIPELMWMRNGEVAGIRNTTPSNTQGYQIKHWWHDNKFKIEKEDFLNRMKIASKEISNDKNYQLTENKIANLFESHVNIQPRFIKNYFLRKILPFVPLIVKRILRIIIGWDKLSRNNDINWKNLDEIISLLEQEGILINYKELDKAISFLRL
jgi:glycosyltransferase domain-containing protein